MKISTFLTMLLICGIIIFIMAQMATEANSVYDTKINQSSWSGQYNFNSEINKTLNPIKSSLEDIQNEDKGWLEKIGSGFTGLIAAVKFLPNLVLSTINSAGVLIIGIGTSFNIPGVILAVFITMMLAWAIFKLYEFFQRQPV